MIDRQFHAVVNAAPNTRAIVVVLIVGLHGLPCSALADALPACMPPVEAVRVKVAGTQSNGVLILKNHPAVKVEGLWWPKGTSALGEFVGQDVTLRAIAPKLDRYRRIRAQVVLTNGKWLQGELLRRGLARVQVAPDRPECAHELYAAETEARAAHVGLWALPQYAIRTSESLRWQDLGSFQIVEGQVLNVKVSGRAYLNFGRNWRTDFTVTISPEDVKTFRREGVDPYSYAGKRVRARGIVDRMNGFEIEVGSPQAIEVLR